MNEIIQSMLAHRSIRSCSERPLEEVNLVQIIRTVPSAPNRVNFQLVSMAVVKDPKRRKLFSRLCGHQSHVGKDLSFWFYALITIVPAGMH